MAIRRRSRYDDEYETVTRLMEKYQTERDQTALLRKKLLKTSGGGGAGGNYANTTYIINDESVNWQVQVNDWANTYTAKVTTSTHPQKKLTPLEWLDKQIESVCSPGRAALR